MIPIQGIWWPDDVGMQWQHALKHLKSLEFVLTRCRQHRVAIQAGGNIGLWPKRMAQEFDRVYTFEPEPVSMRCLEMNVPPKSVVAFPYALGDADGSCTMKRKSLGSHKVREGTDAKMVTIDTLDSRTVDLIQLDVEGFEWQALMGARQTIAYNRPMLQLEVRDSFLAQQGHSEADLLALLAAWEYVEISRQAGSDRVYAPKELV